MISTGVEALNGRLGHLRRASIYTFLGPAASGKSVLGLHFLIEGLEHGEKCVLITRDEPTLIDSRAMFAGYSPGRITEHHGLRLVRLPATIPASHGQSPAEALTGWLAEQLGREAPSRIVLDNVEWLAAYSHSRIDLLRQATRYLRDTGATVYALARPSSEAEVDSAVEAELLDASAGVFDLQISDRGLREFRFRGSPAGAFHTGPFAFSLRNGAGFSEELALAELELDASDRQRLVVLDETGMLSAEVLTVLEQMFELVPLRSTAGSLSTLSAGRYGALVVVVDPFDEMRAFDLVFALRKEGIAAPIVFVAPSRGLRSSTRSRGLRVGGDDFFVADLPPAEIVERIQLAWTRGSHRRNGLSGLGHILQPVKAHGGTRPMTEAELVQAMEVLLAEQPPLFFCYLEFTLSDTPMDVVWPALRTRVRISEGDIIGVLPHQRVACILDRITPEQTQKVVDRIRTAHPGLQSISDVIVIAHPIRANDIAGRIRGNARPDGSPVAMQTIFS